MTGWVADTVDLVKAFFTNNPDGVYLYKDLRDDLVTTDTSNFNKRVRRHESYKLELDRMGLEEITVGNQRHRNALASKSSPLGPIEGSSYFVDV
ncbi:hypothetical protein EOK75_08885 [Pseudorhodobacter turbinis]|uniref:Uncharacterized protein n=1 Tax=Pseudorhodobacter turbinis TaxID=2500533 RepID=A0A4P8EG53_9RHOB|nr:hypothetical protein EOK75_08885 [Pseudorhodobacter turbinis]